MGIVQIRPGGGVPLFRRNLRQGFDPFPILEGDHGYGDAIGHEGQLQLRKQLRHALRAAQRIEIHWLRLPGIADTVQSAQVLAGKGVAGYGAVAVHISRYRPQISRALIDGHQGMTIYQGSP